MTKRVMLILMGVLTASAMFFVACDDEPTQAEANEQFCDDTAEFIASLRVIRDLDANSTFEEVEEARDRARDAYARMIESSEGVVDARLDDLEAANQELQQAVNDIDEDTTLGDALDSVDEELEEVASQASQILNDVDCAGNDQGFENDID
jgi:hypothetical protein